MITEYCVVGVSYNDAIEHARRARNDAVRDFVDLLDGAAATTDLGTVYSNLHDYGQVMEAYIGVVFDSKPTDEEGSAAEAKVRTALPHLISAVGRPSTNVGQWMVRSVTE